MWCTTEDESSSMKMQVSRQAVVIGTVVYIWTQHGTGDAGHQAHGVGGQGNIVCYKLGGHIGNTLHRDSTNTFDKVRSKYWLRKVFF